MESKFIHFTVCRYVPDILRDEFINVGVLVHVPEEGVSRFYKTRNLSRIKNFDDEVELDVIKVLLESLEYQFNQSTIHSPDLENLDDHNFLENETKFYVNQIQFSNIRTLTSDDLDEDIKDLCSTYLYYDKRKSERIDKYKVRSLVSKMIDNSKLKGFVNKYPEIRNNFNQQPFDFSLNLNENETLIKALSFDYKKQTKLFNEIKSFLYDLYYFKELNTDIKVVINNTAFENNFEKVALDQLKQFIEVYTLEEFSGFIDRAEGIIK